MTDIDAREHTPGRGVPHLVPVGSGRRRRADPDTGPVDAPAPPDPTGDPDELDEAAETEQDPAVLAAPTLRARAAAARAKAAAAKEKAAAARARGLAAVAAVDRWVGGGRSTATAGRGTTIYRANPPSLRDLVEYTRSGAWVPGDNHPVLEGLGKAYGYLVIWTVIAPLYLVCHTFARPLRLTLAVLIVATVVLAYLTST